MLNIEQQTIDKLFRDLIRVYSTSATSMIGLDSIKTAIEELFCKDSELVNEIRKLSDTVKNTQPRMFPLDNLMLILDKEIQTLNNEKQLTKGSIDKILNTFRIRIKSDFLLILSCFTSVITISLKSPDSFSFSNDKFISMVSRSFCVLCTNVSRLKLIHCFAFT